jgi:hypothetical protein
MKTYFAITLSRCYVASKYTGSIDIGCRYYEKDTEEAVALAIRDEGNCKYLNSDGEEVEWVLDNIVQIDEVDKLTSGDEVSGFICHEAGLIQEVSQDKLDEIEKRCNAATSAPWKSYIEGRDHLGGDSVIQTSGEDIYLTGATASDQDFIAHARQDIPMLLNEIKRLRALLDEE